MNPKSIIIGLTGSFGSGCTSLAEVLSRHFGFDALSLSKEVREEASRRGINNPTRDQLQTLGNELRKRNGADYLARAAMRAARRGKKFVFDGFRNPAEVDSFREYRHFYLVAISASKDIRWQRLLNRGVYKVSDRTEFDRNDARDQDEHVSYGQRVVACVDQAEILLTNEKNYETPAKIESVLETKFSRYFELITKKEDWSPMPEETLMSVASTLALQSSCIKRGVGAVLCNAQDQIIAAGYNEVPVEDKSCFEEYKSCYRDLLRDDLQNKFIEEHVCCPVCGTKNYDKSNREIGPVCTGCATPLLKFFPKPRMMDKCRAIHAEEAVLLGATDTAEGTLYTTTSPCMQCAKRIARARISEVIYVDPYPEEEAVKLLSDAGIKMRQFEGVKGHAFHRIYQWQREEREAKAERLRREER